MKTLKVYIGKKYVNITVDNSTEGAQYFEVIEGLLDIGVINERHESALRGFPSDIPSWGAKAIGVDKFAEAQMDGFAREGDVLYLAGRNDSYRLMRERGWKWNPEWGWGRV